MKPSGKLILKLKAIREELHVRGCMDDRVGDDFTILMNNCLFYNAAIEANDRNYWEVSEEILNVLSEFDEKPKWTPPTNNEVVNVTKEALKNKETLPHIKANKIKYFGIKPKVVEDKIKKNKMYHLSIEGASFTTNHYIGTSYISFDIGTPLAAPLLVKVMEYGKCIYWWKSIVDANTTLKAGETVRLSIKQMTEGEP